MHELSPRPQGLLTSQVGYELHLPKRAIYRAGERRPELDSAPWQLIDLSGRIVTHGVVEYWGSLWGAHWWVIDFSSVRQPLEARIQLGSSPAARSDLIRIAADVLTGPGLKHVELMAIDQLERRARFAKAKRGWLDAGMPWQEANAHASMILGLCDVLEHLGGRLTESLRGRLIAQVINGCDYLAMCQDEASRRGHAPGGLSHQIPDYEDEVIVADAGKASAAWARCALLMPEHRSVDADRARRALRFATTTPINSAANFNHHQRGLSASYVPANAPITRDLLMCARAAVLLEDRTLAKALLARVMSRQARPDEAIAGLSGFFFEFDDRNHAEPAWVHQIQSRPLGVDAGGSHAYDVGPFVLALRLMADDVDAPRWRACLDAFATGFLIPACQANPFGIVPQLLHREHGLIWFAGPWHGMNCIYGQAAGVCFELASVTGIERLIDIGYANLQWVAGLNAGVTRDALKACHVHSQDIGPEAVLAVSMIQGIGRRVAGGWLGFRGSVCNGFATGEQFRFDVPVCPLHDAPSSLTDEDWIPHTAGFLSGLSRMPRAGAAQA
jgi:hypothetical protein